MEPEQAVTRTSPDADAAVGPAEGAAPAGEAAESSEALRQALTARTQEAERLQDRLLRLQAEFENYKRRMAREKAEFLKFAHEELILEFLPVLDNLERALGAARAEAGSTPLLEGIEMIVRLFRSVLEKAGVKPMETIGQPFDRAGEDVLHFDALECGDGVLRTLVRDGTERGVALLPVAADPELLERHD